VVGRLRERTRARVRSERGDTLVEVLMTIVIIGIAFTGILAGLATASRVSGIHRAQANADVVLSNAAESVKKQTYVACPLVDVTSYSPTSGVTLPTGWSASNVTITSIQKWNGSAFQASCPLTDQGLQQVTIQVVTPTQPSTTETIDVIKRVTT